MRIGIYDPYLDDAGGGEKYMMTIAECLSKKNNVDVFWDDRQDLQIISKRFNLNLSKVNLVKNIFSKNVPLFKRIVESGKYDIIVVLSDGSIPLLLSKKLFVHFQQPILGATFSSKSGFKKMRVSSFFCNSNFTKSFIDKKFGIKSKVIYPPVEINSKKIKKENIILTVGRFRVRDVLTKASDYKKFPIMTEGFKKLIKEGIKDWKLVLAVSVKNDDEKIFSRLKESTKGYPIEFLVNKSNAELWDIYSKAKIYWHASGFGEDLEAHPEFAEHFGISTVEAMGAGAVPVVINAGGQKEIVQDDINGFLWNTIEELKSKTKKLMKDDQLITRLSTKAKESSREFSTERFCKEINEFIL